MSALRFINSVWVMASNLMSIRVVEHMLGCDLTSALHRDTRMWRHTENNYLLGCVLKTVLFSSVKRLKMKSFHIQKTLKESHLGEITLAEVGSKCAKKVS